MKMIFLLILLFANYLQAEEIVKQRNLLSVQYIVYIDRFVLSDTTGLKVISDTKIISRQPSALYNITYSTDNTKALVNINSSFKDISFLKDISLSGKAIKYSELYEIIYDDTRTGGHNLCRVETVIINDLDISKIMGWEGVEKKEK